MTTYLSIINTGETEQQAHGYCLCSSFSILVLLVPVKLISSPRRSYRIPPLNSIMALAALADVLYPGSGLLSAAFLARLALLLVLYVLGWIVYCRVFHTLADVPGPFLASISRLWIGASVSGGRADQVQRALHQKHGPLVRIAHNEVSVADPAAIKTIYSVKSGFTKTDFYPPFAPNVSSHGDHFTQLDEAAHAERRKYVNSIYSMSTILESEKYIDDCSDVFLEKMAKMAREKKEIDFGGWIQWLVFSPGLRPPGKN